MMNDSNNLVSLQILNSKRAFSVKFFLERPSNFNKAAI
jgi:hypothetical protein